jgi:class 3 adenylate cyclase
MEVGMMLIRHLSLQSKLVLMLLAVSIASIAVIGYIGYSNGREAITRIVFDQLAGSHQIKATAVTNRIRTIREHAITLSAAEVIVNAMKDFRAGYAEVAREKVPLDKEWEDGLSSFYRQVYLPALSRNVDGQPVLETYLPSSPPARYLQYQYIARPKDIPYEQKVRVVASGDGGAYDAAHQKYQPRLSRVTHSFGYQDLMLIDAETGDIVYTVEKSTEFATNLLHGTYADTGPGELFRAARRMDKGAYKFSDFERYRPTLNKPAAFTASPIFDGNDLIGVLVLQYPIDEINRVMTGAETWQREGLGRSGEVILVGPDYLMRSRSRLLWEDRERFYRELAAAGVTTRQIETIRRSGTAILALEVRTPAAERALAGKEGVIFEDDVMGVPVIAAYAPLEVEGLRWAIVGKMDVAEAFAPVAEFGRKVLAYSVGIILVVTLLAMVLAHVFTRPLRGLIEGARQVGAGRLDVEVKVDSGDEFRELADAFNEMTRGLKEKAELAERKVRENEELLLNILPGPVVARMKEGDGRVTESFADVTVLFAEVHGLTELSEAIPAARALGLLNDLIIAFDEAAERHGVEKVKTVGASYLAVCGLSERRPDHTNRVVEFARELRLIVERFNKERGTDLTVGIGINAGPVVGGIMGRSKFIYDLWGATVNVARALKSDRVAPIRVTEEVRDRLRDLDEFEGRTEVEIKGGGRTAAWALKD